MTDFKVVIPSRYQSTRLPGKPLLEIAGKPMIQHVVEQAQGSDANEVIVATDDQRIFEAVKAFGGEVCMTSDQHQSGTDRLAEVVQQYGWPDDEIIVNVQGDEPEMPATLINQVAYDMASHKDAVMTTLSTPIEHSQDVFDPNVVKLVTDEKGYALYFSRAAIPWQRDEFASAQQAENVMQHFARHIGLYAYRAGFLQEYIQWSSSPLEQQESLEQLRVLWHGKKIHVSQATESPGVGVDTAEDLERVKRQMGY